VIAAIEWTLADFLTAESTALAAVDPALGGFARIARDCVLAGGKRLRPAFAYWGWRGIVGPHAYAGPVVPALAALELLHAFALVHDDVMDESDTRRGRPTAHRVLAAAHAAAGRRGPAERFGRSAAVLIGDLCLVWADRLMASATVPAEALLAARRCYDQMRIEAVAGQYLDLCGEADPGGWSVARAMRVARHKTASYTVLRPLQFGAALAGDCADGVGGNGRGEAREEIMTAYERYGVAVGEAFQLRDDLLGVYGDPLVTGKPAGDDLRTGKPTALLLLGRRLATPAQRTELDRGLAALAGPPAAAPPAADPPAADPPAADPPAADPPAADPPAAVVDRLGALLAETGAVDRVTAMAERRVAAALAAVDAAPIHPVARRALRRLAGAAARRRA
jgi:geranylgeranyl diphosphate synthase type I